MFSVLKSGKSTTKNSAPAIQTLTAQALEQGFITRKNHLLLATAMLGVAPLTPQDRSCINRVFDAIRMGQIRLED